MNANTLPGFLARRPLLRAIREALVANQATQDDKK